MTNTSLKYSDGVSEILAGWPVSVMASAETDLAAYDALVERGSRSFAGTDVTHRTATHLGPVWQAVTQISGDIAKMPLELYRRDAKGSQGQALAHPAYYKIKHQPNGEMQAARFWKRVMVHALLWGNAYIWAQWSKNGVLANLVPLLPDRTYPERVDGNLYYATEVDGRAVALDNLQVIHIEGIVDQEGFKGLDPTIEARDSWGLALARMGFAARFFRNGGRVGGNLELPASTPKPIRDKVESGFRRVYENSDEAFRTVVLRDNAKFHAAQHTFEDTQLVESSREGTREVARWFNIKPSRLGEEGGQSYNSKAEDNRDYLDTTLSPWMSQIKAECERVLLTEPQRRREEYWFRWDTKTLLQMSQLERYQGYEIGIRSEFLSPNEARESEGMNHREGGDRFGNPNINPAAHVALLNTIARKAMAELAGKRGAFNHKPTMAWTETQIDKLQNTFTPAVQAYASIFGGKPEMIANRVATRLVVQYLADTDSTSPITALHQLDCDQIIQGALNDDP